LPLRLRSKACHRLTKRECLIRVEAKTLRYHCGPQGQDWSAIDGYGIHGTGRWINAVTDRSNGWLDRTSAFLSEYFFKSASDHFSEKLDAPRQSRAIRGLTGFGETAKRDEFAQFGKIVGQYDGIVQELLMALVAEDGGLALEPPRALIEDPIGLGATAVSGTTEETLSDKMVPCGVAATFTCVACVGTRRPVKAASTDGTRFHH
jgi:hypothetical protein